MTEAEWDICTEPQAMLDWLRQQGKLSERKARLFAVACCERIRRLITDPDALEALAFADRHAEAGVVRRRGRAAVERAAQKAHWAAYNKMFSFPSGVERAKCLIVSNALDAAAQTLNTEAYFAARYAASFSCFAVAWEAQVVAGGDAYPDLRDSFKQPEMAQQALLLRDLFGNPFRPLPPIAPSVLQWSGGLIKRLAEQAHEHRIMPAGTLDPARLAVLADALEEAGADAALVAHLRERGPHWRGCWAVDLALGRE